MSLESLRKIRRQMEGLKSQVQSFQQKKNSQTSIPRNIVDYAKSKGYTLTPDQIAVLNSVLSNKATICPSAHAVGKSTLAAILACWFFQNHPGGVGIVTAPVNAQIGQIIFKEMRRIFPDGPFLPKANSLYGAHDWWVNGIPSSKPDAFQGKHAAGGILIILDECSGVPQDIWTRSFSMFENGRQNHYFLGIGNPYSMSSPMFLESQNHKKYNVISISALSHPNVVQKKEVIPGAISYETVSERIKTECRPAFEQDYYRAFDFEGKKYVSENPLFDVQILGKYPTQQDWSLFSESDLFNVQLPIPDKSTYKVQIGVDVARFGSARTVICVRRGPNIIHVESHRGLTIVQTAEKIKACANKYQQAGFSATKIPCCIDGTGIGSGVVDLCGTAANKYNFIEVHNSHKPNEDFENYVNNKRSELWVNLRDFCRNKQLSISLLPREMQLEVMKEMRLPEFTIDTKGRTVLEPKDKISKRLGQSPDIVDAVALSCLSIPKSFESHF